MQNDEPSARRQQSSIDVFPCPFEGVNLMRQNISLVVIFQVIFLGHDMPNEVCFFSSF